MIVEDEQIERETLYKIVKECFPQCHLVICAKNGKEALVLYEEYEPNIILADINIPGINGLEVIRKIKGKNHEVEFLVLSSYNYFEYAQEALRLGADDFILKPYTINYLKEALEKIIEHIEKKHTESRDRSKLLEKINEITPVLENNVVYAIVSNENELNLRTSLRLLDPMICWGFCFLLKGSTYDFTYVKSIAEGFKGRGYRCIKELFHGVQIFYVFGNHIMEQANIVHLSSYIEAMKIDSYQYGIGSIESDVQRFHQSYRIACNRFDDTRSVFEQLMDREERNNGKEMLRVERYIERFMHMFIQMDEEGLKAVCHRLNVQLIPLNKDQIIPYVDAFFTLLKEKAQHEYPQAKIHDIEIQQLKISNNIYQEVPLYVRFYINKIYDAIVKERFKNTSLLVKQAIQYIDRNYRKQITLSDIAEELQVSPYYVSKLLSTSLHKTFTELIAQRRVEASKELLKSNKRIKEIAYMVGFQGQNYFAKIFKKYTGVTPKVYKNSFEE